MANLYPTFSYGDYPERWAPAAPKELDESTARHRERLYLWLEDQVTEPFVMGDDVCVLDVYLAVLVAWRPGSAWFHRNTPKIARVAERTRQLPPVANVMKLNGW